jgi:peptidoglycan-associated lipoprotein
MTMIPSSTQQSIRNFFVALILAILAACSTTQKSSTGMGDQAAAPISDASAPPGTEPDAAASSTIKSTDATDADAGAPLNPASVPPAETADAGGTEAGAPQTPPADSAATGDSDEAAQLKRQLADQDAQINQMRNEQQADAARQGAEAEQQQQQQQEQQQQPPAAEAAQEQSGQPSGGAAPDAQVAKTEQQQEVFPSNGTTAESGGADNQPAVPQALERSVYFDYDQAAIPEKYDSLVLANSAYLRAHPDLKVEVQGNCDERGSREYNLALGARRAEAVKRALELGGADGSRIHAVSFGSEKPIALGKDEASYSQNRRADIMY